MYPISFVLPKETGIPPKKSAFCLVRRNLTLADICCVVIPEQYTFLSVAAVRYFLSSPVLVTIWGDFGILECPHGPFRRNAARLFLYTPVLVTIWGDFGILECPHGPFRRNAACTFPVCTSIGKCLGRFWNIGMSARTFQEKTEGRTLRLQCLAGALLQSPCLVNTEL